jgi:hypothetical protein
MMDEARQAQLARALEEGRARLQSARLLWRGDRLVDAYLFGADALRALAWGWAGGASRVEVAARTLAAAGYRGLPELAEALSALDELPVPRTDREFARIHQRGLERAFAAAERLSAFTVRALRSPAQRRARVRRFALLGAVTAVAALVVAIWIGRRPLLTASAVYSQEFPAAAAGDGLVATEWLLPGGQTGWLDVGFRRGRQVRLVRVTNGHNRHYRDRATRRFRVTAFAGERPVATAEAEFDGITSKTPERVVRIEARSVTRVRVEVLSHFGTGAGLAEVRIE